MKCCVRLSNCFSTAALLALIGTSAQGQHFADIQLGSIQVKLDLFASDLAGDFNGEFQVSPTDLVPFGDGSGRLAVATLGGVTRVIDGSGNLLNTALLTKAQSGTQVPDNGEWGQTSIAFHPDFGNVGAAGYGKFYTINTENPSLTPTDFGNDFNHQDIVKEWTLADHTANTWGAAGDTSRELLRVGQPGQPHNVVDLAFGPDKTLYISSGDGGAAISGATNPATIFGNILRIDPLGNNSTNGNYGIPSDNPYANGETVTVFDDSNPGGFTVDPLDEVFAYGFRSPFRMNFDSATGDLYVGDVGQSDIEEINRVVAGGNYGWNSKEGSFKSGQNLGASRVEPDTVANNGWSSTQTLAEQFGFIDPLFEYDHDEGRSISGGFVYRGSAIPELQGMYVFADLGEAQPSARIFYGDPNATDSTDFFEIDIDGLGLGLPIRIISIGEDDDGELYLVAVGQDPRQGGGVDGQVLKIVAPDAPYGLQYDPSTGHVLIDTNGDNLTSYLLNGTGFLEENHQQVLAGVIDSQDFEIAEADPLGGGSGILDLGAILPQYMSEAEFLAFLTKATYTSDLGGGLGDFDLVYIGIPSDLDSDGDVDDADFGLAFAAFTGPGNGPSSNPAADLDGDGDVDDADFGLAFAAFTGPGGATNVPEPTGLALLAVGAGLIFRRYIP